MKKILGMILVLSMVMVVFVGCESSEAREEEKVYQENLMQQSNDAVGMPNITNFYEKKLAKKILELRDDSKLICYAYSYSDYTGLYTYLGRCMGYGLPYSTQYTCPDSAELSHGEVATLPQADPNGLYSSDSTAATWLYMINENTGNPEVMYFEPNVVVYQSTLPRRLCVEKTLPENYDNMVADTKTDKK